MRSFLTKKSITRTLLLGAVSAAFVLPASPAHAVAAVGIGYADDGSPWMVSGVCTGQAVSTNGETMTLVVEGAATSQGPAIDTGIICHARVNGVYAGAVGGTGIGNAAAAAGRLEDLPLGGYTFCAEVSSVYLNSSARSSCPTS
ncbi:MAG: hypothetical protein M3279_07225 [Actinomycetota bacterium]|nr:hypothetical protein [Actinomycetota bacterium]